MYARKAFSPIPGARANGRFANIPITKVAMAEERAVAVKTAPVSILAAPKIFGFTARI